jgi:hypothetical protein
VTDDADGPRASGLEPPQDGEIEPVPVADPPSGDMRPLDLGASSPPHEYAAAPPPYVPQPVPFDAPTQPTGPAGVAPTDEPLLPTTMDDNALRDAVGPPLPEPKRKRRERLDDDGTPKPAGRRTFAIVAIALLVGLTIAGFVLLGRVNASRFVIACSTTQVTAEQGRGFPPWGTRPLVGPEWKPIGLPPNAECRPRETEDKSELESWYLDVLVDRASTTLTARNLLDSVQPNKANPLDLAQDQLNQALLLSRAPERRDQRKEVERLLGDVQYWRAALRLRDASAALVDASHQFEAAAAQRPRHVTDAAEWATFLRHLADDLQAGPAGAHAVAPVVGPVEAGSDRPSVPMGTALPVEPTTGSDSEPAPAPPDAGLPTGGVLL